MITPDQVKDKAQRLWRPFLQAWLAEESFFPVEFPVGRLPMDEFEQLNAGTKALINASKTKRGAGYTLHLQTQRTKYGSQSLPRKIVIETEDDFLTMLKRKDKFQQFKTTVHLIRTQFPELEHWVRQHPFAVLKYAEAWNDLLSVCRYLCQHVRPNLYARELPIAVHTKFIEQHKGILRALLDVLLPLEAVEQTETHFERRFGLRYDEPLIRIRFLDTEEQDQTGLPFHDLSIPMTELAQWAYRPRRVLIVENKLTFLTLPPLSKTLALWGGGFRVQLLENLPWLRTTTIIYWGDLDAHGFQILSQLRHVFPNAVSLMMDRETLEQFQAYVVAGTPTSTLELPYLSQSEHSVYQHIQQSNLRLEQERIALSYAVRHLGEV